MSRYNKRTKATNNTEMYENIFEQRGVRKILQYTTPILSYPDTLDSSEITVINYVWNQGDKFWRLAHKHYGNSSYWWVIAQFNKKPTEGHLNPGDTIQIPVDLSVVLGAFN